MTAGAAQPGSGITAVLVGAERPELPASGIQVLARAVSAAAATRSVAQHRPDLVLVDLDSTGSAVAVIDAVVSAAPSIPVLALATAADHDTVLAAVRAGASSLLIAPDPDGLAAAAARTVAGQAVFSPGLAEVVLAEVGRPADPLLAARRLTDRESDVLRLVVEGLTARQIGTRLGLSPRTVENHVQNVLRKLQLRSRAALVRYAVEHGLA
jgi:DNA-binding NarL/FixJ family response regulator